MNRTPRIARSLAVLALPALALAGCAGGESPEDGGASAPVGEANPDASLRLGLVLEPDNLDIRHTSGAALEQILAENVYEGLVQRTEDNGLEPSLATEWEVSDDRLTYTFTLVEGATFHSGADLTAQDAAWSLAQAVEDETIVGHADLAAVSSVTAPDDTTVVVELSEPDANLLWTLSGPAGFVFDEGDDTDLRTAANGSGPFELTDWAEGDSIVLSRYDGYWGDPAGVAEVVASYIPDFTAGVNAALDGSLDVLTAVDPQLAPQLDGNGFSLTTGRTTDKYVLAFNNAVAPLDDARVREALRLAIDHEALVETVGAGVVQYGPIPELDPGYEDLSDVAPFDPDRAEALLAEAGQEDLELELTIPSFYGTTIPTFLVSAFHDIGVELTVDPVEFPTWLNDVYTNGDYELSVVNHVEPRDFAAWANPDYYFHYDNAEVQELYAASRAAESEDEAADLLAQAARIVSEDHAADWLYTAETIVAVGDGISGFPVDSINARLDLSRVAIAG